MPAAEMINGTIIGEIRTPITADLYGICGWLRPSAAVVPRIVAKIVDAIAIMKLFLSECVH
jgi:hypothetical protein